MAGNANSASLPRAIVHLDDFGMSRSTNRAVQRALLAGWASSASVMVPCPWFRDAAAFSASHPELCVGVHITLVSEWPRYKWRPVIGASAAPSLCDEFGFMMPPGSNEVRGKEFARRAVVSEVKAEARAQVQLALACGMQPTHIDYHCGSILASPALRQVVYEIACEFKIPAVLFPTGVSAGVKAWDQNVPASTPVLRVDRLLGARGNEFPLEDALEELHGDDGLAYVILHPAELDDELRGICLEEPYGADHRAADLQSLERQPLRKSGALAHMVSCREAFQSQSSRL